MSWLIGSEAYTLNEHGNDSFFYSAVEEDFIRVNPGRGIPKMPVD